MPVSVTIAALVAVLDRTVAFLRGRQNAKAKSFEEDVQPLFDAMLQIHHDYRNSFAGMFECWNRIKSREELLEILRKRKHELQPLRDVTYAIVDEFSALESADSDFRVFYWLCKRYFGFEVGQRTHYSTLIGFVSLVDGNLILSESNKAPTLNYLMSLMETIEFCWSDICRAYAKIKANR